MVEKFDSLMKVIINCGVCTDLHTFDNVETVILVRQDRSTTPPVCTHFGNGKYLLVYWKNDEADVFDSGNFTRKQLEALGKYISHLATHYPGKGFNQIDIECNHA